MTRYDTARDAIHGDEFQYIPASKKANMAKLHLSHHGLIGAIEELLPCLPPGIKGSADKGSTKTASGQAAAVLPRERHALGDTLIDDPAADLS